jgi:short-subunit dehydrogenase
MLVNADSKRVVVITGCSSGIGKCLATELKNNYTIVATVRNPQDKQALLNLGIDSITLDLADPSSVQTASQYILQKYSDIYAIIHNAAYGQAGALLDVSREVLEAQFATNVFGVHQLTNALLPNLLQQSSARIIYISSVLGLVAAPFRGCYNASKFALEGLAQTLRLELADTNIKVSTIQPGPITSKFRENAYQSFRNNIDVKNSIYQKKYQTMIQRLKNDAPSRWTLPPQAVVKKVQHALEKTPKNHYRITIPTKVVWILQRFLSSRIIDKILIKQ